MDQMTKERMEHYPPLSSVVIAKIFEDDRNADLACTLINAILRNAGEPEIQNIIQLKSEYPLAGRVISQGEISRGGRLDIRAVASDGRIFSIEILLYFDASLGDRSLFYGAKILSESTPAGASFGELPHVVVINIMKKGPRDAGGWHYRAALRYLDDEGELDSDKLIIHYIDLSRFEALCGEAKAEDLPELGRWLRYFTRGYLDEAEGKELMTMDEGLRKFAEEYRIALNDPDLKRIYDFYMSGVIDEALRVNHARREGKAEGYAEGEARGRAEGEARGRAEGEARGRAEGKAEGLLEAARNLKLEGLSAEKIAKITGLPQKTIESL